MSVASTADRSRLAAYAIGGFGMAVNAMIQFLLPLRAVELGVGIGVIGLLLGAKGVAEAFSSVPIGALIDRVGARRAYIIGTAATATLAVAYSIATTAFAFFALQVLLGLVRPLGWVGSQSYVSGMRKGKDKAADTGRFGFVASGSQIVAPLLVGVVAQYVDLSAAFLALSAYCAVFAALGMLLPHQDSVASSSGRKNSLAEAVDLLRLSGIRVVMLLTFTRLWIPSVWTAFFPLLLVTSGTSEAAAASAVSAMGVMATFIGLIVGRLSRLGRDVHVTAVALIAGCAGLIVAPFVGGVPMAYLSSALVGIGQGVSLPMLIVLVTAAAPAARRATALGLRSSVNQVAAAVAPSAVAGLLSLTAATVGFPVAGAVGLTFVAAALITDRVGGAAPDAPPPVVATPESK